MAKSKGHKDDIEMPEDEDTNEHGLFWHETRPSREDIEPLRFLVLGSDDVLVNDACAIILGLPRGENDRCIQGCTLREGPVGGRQVSVLKTPSYWLEHLISYHIFSKGVKSMRRDIAVCDSLLFPGPHVFLLVLGDASNSGKEHLLLQALSDIYGKEALDYSMVLFFREYGNSDVIKNTSVKMCGHRRYILKNTEDSVFNLLYTIDEMSQIEEKNRYFAKQFKLLERAKKCFQRESDEKYAARERSLKTQWVENIKTIKDQKNEIVTELKRQNKFLYKELDALNMAVNHLRRDLDDFRDREDQLQVDNKKLQSEIELLKATEKHMEKNSLGSITQKNAELQVKETELCMRARDLETKEKDLEFRERDLSRRNSWSGVLEYIETAAPLPANKFRLHEGDGAESSDVEIHKSRDQTEGWKPVRRQESDPFKRPSLRKSTSTYSENKP